MTRWLCTGLVFLGLCSSAQAQVSPSGPPQNAPMPDSAQPQPTQSENEARQKFAGGGYPNVRELKSTSDGGWTATADVNGRNVKIRITPAGEIDKGG